jgi:beta-glucosidase
MKKVLVPIMAVFVITLAGCGPQVPQEVSSQADAEKISGWIESMSLEEKAYFVTGTGMSGFGLQTEGFVGSPGAPVVGQTQSLVPGAAGTTYELADLGITPMVLADGPAGLRISPVRPGDTATYYCTAFPVATLLASSWDTGLITRVGEAMGSEVLEYGADILLGPGMNIHRNPLCGRNFEYYSEDPFLTGKMAAAMVNGVESKGVGTSIKHYAANNTETNRNALNTIVSERALREIYLEGFRIAVEESQPWTVMSSYNLINGTYAPENHDLLTKVLHDDWGFEGFVMTDWFGGRDPVAMMKAGNDLIMPGLPMQAEAILKAMKDGTLDVAVVDRNIERILKILIRSPRYRGYAYSGKPDLRANAEVTREAATQGMVLLKNEGGALPLAEDTRLIAAFGKTSIEIVTGGTGSGDVNEAYSVSLVDGLRGAGYDLHEGLLKRYSKYLEAEKAKLPPVKPFMPSKPIPEMEVDILLARRAASEADVALITIGRNSGEFFDRKIEDDFNLSVAEAAMIRNVCDAFHEAGKKAVVILNIGGVIETASWKDIPDAILLAWQAGQETGNSVADVISGKVNPSGKLTATFPIQYGDVPSAGNFPGRMIETDKVDTAGDDIVASFMNPRFSEVVYEEGIYVGYRYYSTFKVPVSYEFGYGLSYTGFEYGNMVMSSDRFKKSLTVSVDVHNTGELTGREVVQLYLSAPEGSLDKPAFELKGFAKTGMLAPGEKQTLTFELTPGSLASFDPSLSAWIAAAGKYTVMIGASSGDIRKSGNFTLSRDITVREETRALAPTVSVNELKP